MNEIKILIQVSRTYTQNRHQLSLVELGDGLLKLNVPVVFTQRCYQ